GAYCLRVDDPGVNAWDAQVRHREMVIENGHTYTVSFRAWSDKPTRLRSKVGMSGPTYQEYWTDSVQLTQEPPTVQGTFTMGVATDPTRTFESHVGGNPDQASETPIAFCIDDVYLRNPQFSPPATTAPRFLPTVRRNQVGYFPGARKIA